MGNTTPDHKKLKKGFLKGFMTVPGSDKVVSGDLVLLVVLLPEELGQDRRCNDSRRNGHQNDDRLEIG